jgi:competence protein ComEC
MPVRRPLCFISLVYALGIGSAYIFSADVRILAALVMVSAAAMAFVFAGKVTGGGVAGGAFFSGVAGDAAAFGAVGRRMTSGAFAFILAFVFFAGGACCAHELQRGDALENYAASRYNNTGYGGSGGEKNTAGNGAVKDGDSGSGKETAGNGVDDGDGYGDENIATPGVMPVQRGRVLKVRVRDGDRMSLTVSSGGGNVLVNVNGGGVTPADIIGREIAFAGSVELPAGRRNPGTFDYALYLKTQGVRVIVSCDPKDVNVVPSGRSPVWDFYASLCRLKYSFLGNMRAAMPEEEYELFAGMMFGGSSEMDEENYDMFRRNGVAHILSVSGLHVAIVYAFLNLLFGRRRTIPVYAAIAAALICYAALSEFSPSVVRAVTMIGLHVASKILNLRYDLLTGTMAAAFIMLLANPLDLLSVGFRLSFLAVLLLAFATPLAGRYYGYRDSRTGKAVSDKDLGVRKDSGFADALRTRAVNMAVPLVVIQLGMAPLIAYEFNYVSLTGLVLNPPVVALAGWALPVGVSLLILHALSLAAGAAVGEGIGAGAVHAFDGVTRLAAEGEGAMCGGILDLTRMADAVPHGSFDVTSPPVQLVLLFYGVLFFMMSETRTILFARTARSAGKMRGYRRIALICAGVALAAALTFASPVCRQDRSSLVFVDVGQGDCLHIRTPDGRNYLVDGGGNVDYKVGAKTLLPYLLKNGVGRLDGVFATHLHTDHWRGLCELSERMDVGKVYIYEGNRVIEEGIAEVMKVDEGDFRYIAQGDAVTLGAGVKLDVLYPPRRAEEDYLHAAEEEAQGRGDENANSLIMKVDYEGVTALMTGDAGEEAERALLEISTSALRSRILKVGHHGSKYSTTDDFLTAVAPDAAVIQVGRNTFGHPTKEVLDKLVRDDIMVFRNDLGGAIMFAVRDGKVRNAESCATRFQDY